MSLFAELSAALPTKREIRPAGWPRSVWIHRLQLEAIVALAAIQPEGESESLDWIVHLVSKCLGDEARPCDFDTDEARQWLCSQPAALQELSAAAIALNELGDAHPDRKKE